MTEKTHKTNKSTCTQEHVDRGMAYIRGAYKDEGEVIPTTDGLAVYLDVCRKTPYNWSTQESNPFREEMAYITDRVQSIQGMLIANGGLTGDFNPSFAGKLAANHGYGEKFVMEHSGPNGGPVESSININFKPVGRKSD